LISVIVMPRLLTRNHELRAALASALQVSADRQQDFFVNLPPVEFGRVVGLYIATLFVVWQIVNFAFFGAVPPPPVLLGGALIVIGGGIVTFWGR